MKKHLHCMNPYYKLMQLMLVLAFTFGSILSFAGDLKYSDSWGKQGLSLKKQSSEGLNLNFSVQQFSFEDRDVNGHTMQAISFSESFLPNGEGNPDLPGFSRFIAVPQGAKAILNIVNMRTERFENIEIAPAPRIPLDTDKSPLQYSKNQQIYSKNAFFPATPVTLTGSGQIRGIDVSTLSIQPYQYNPVTKELIVYRDIEINITFEGGNKQFGDTKYRSPYWDQILEDIIFNYSELPVVDYDARSKNHSRSVGYDYLIIVPNDPIFSQWADSIKKFRNEEGIYTGVVKLSEIGANVNAATLETYVNTAYNTWDIVPSAILLLGDYGTQNNNSITSPIYDNYCVSDNILADVDGNHLPDIVFARITAQNAAQLQSMISRFMKYERNPPTNPGFYANPVTALGWQTERWFQICSEVVGGFWKAIGKTPVRINEVYQGTPGSIWSSATNTTTVVNYYGPNGLNYIPQSPSTLGGWTGGTPTMINNALNAGAFMLMHRDHGNETGWGEPGYQSGNINGLTNTDLSWILSINCLTGKYNWSSECFTEKFHRYNYLGQPAGALGLTAASETSYSFVNDVYIWGMMDNMWPNFMPAYGTTPASRGVLPAFGNAAGKYFLYQSNWPYNTGNKEVTYHLFHHHGDAFVKVCTEVPQNILAAYNHEQYQSDTTIRIQTVANASICVSVYGSILATTNTGINTLVEINIPQQQVGTVLKVTITKPNCNRYEGYITIIQDITSANAGEDATICADQQAQLNGVAHNYNSILWTTAGTGTFSDATIINPVYTPSAEDAQNGSVLLSMTAHNTTVGDSTDYMTLTLVPIPTVNAGVAASICEGDSYSTSEASASNYTELYWSTNGTGTFSDINALVTRYTPSAEDITAGNIVLTLNAGNATCEVHTSNLPIAINPKPVVNITGPAVACQNQSGVIYSAESNTNTYEWQVVGGTIAEGANANNVIVDWTGQGDAVVTLMETNEFGCTTSQDYAVMLNAAPQPVITGDEDVCANTTGAIYSTPYVEGNSYTWNINGGVMASTDNINEVVIDWGDNGNGSVSVLETNTTNLCATTTEMNVLISSPVITLAQDTAFCVNHTLTLGVETGYTTYAWSTGATTPSIQLVGEQLGVSSNNTYEVTVTDANGCSTVRSITVAVEACTGLPESNYINGFTVYPNPNTGDFNISFNNSLTGLATVKILNTTGKELYSKTLNINNSAAIESFSVLNLSSGLYFIRVETNTGTTTQKLIIK